jgi:hypothetical protein
MALYVVGFDGKWQERFRDRDEALSWAEEVAATGRVVEVVQRQFFMYRFVTGFPESEREALHARWKWASMFPGSANTVTASDNNSAHRYNSAYGGSHAGGHAHHGGGHGGGH